MRSYPGFARYAVAGLVGLAACAAPGDNTPTALQPPTSAQLVIGEVTSATPELGKLKVCKTGNHDGTFTFTRLQHGDGTVLGYIFGLLADATIDAGDCRVVAEDNGGDGIWSIVTLTETSPGLVSVGGQRIDAQVGGGNPIISALTFANGGTFEVNSFHGATITFENFVAPPPPAPCDFITFGRLVTSLGDDKVVISGNAGGNKPGGGILGEFHVEINGVDHHVTDIDSYGPIASGALSNLTNSRVVTGTAKDGVAVELRLWDGGEPGKDTDVVWVRLNGVVTLTTRTIDQGNMQYHAVCRGPGD
jgi:hypothetical protein